MLASDSKPKKLRSHHDLTRMTFGRLTAIERIGRDSGGWLWIFFCSCGEVTNPIRAATVIAGITKSCGCLSSETTSKRMKKEANVAHINQILRNYRREANKNAVPFEISSKEIGILISANCDYCGRVPANRLNTHYQPVKVQKISPFLYNGIDRVENDKGYIKSNLVPCCKHCNSAKETGSLLDFIKWIEAVKRCAVWKK